MNPPESFYEILLQQPLFQGLGYHDITEIVSKAKFDFQKYAPGTVVRAENSPCHDMLFILKGEISSSHASESRKVIFTETMRPPTVIGIESIFGMTQYYNRTYLAKTDLQTLSISKEFITHNLLSFEVFRFNILGMLCTRLQRTERSLWETPNQSLMRRFIQVCLHNYLLPYGPKLIKGKMVDLAVYVDATRLNLSRLLNNLQDEGLLQIFRKHLEIPHFEKLIQYSQDNTNK